MRTAREAWGRLAARWGAGQVATETAELVCIGGGALEPVVARRSSTWEPGLWEVPGRGAQRLGETLFPTVTEAIEALRSRLAALAETA